MIFDDQGLPMLAQFSEEDFVDCVFKIHDLKSRDDVYTFTLFASHEGKTVGFAVTLLKDIGPGFDGDMNLISEHVCRPGLRFESIGEPSDNLITVLADLYGLGKGALRMIPEESFTAIALHQEDISLETDEVKIKIFGRDGEPFVEEDYFESFFNVDLSGGFVFWNEKDPDYRAPLVRALGAG